MAEIDQIKVAVNDQNYSAVWSVTRFLEVEMKKSIVVVLMGLVFSVCSNAYAWVVSSGATVSEIIQWHDNQRIYFRLSSGKVCFIPADEDKFYSLILSLWATERTADFHCWEDVRVTQGVSGHRLHRIITKN